MRDSPLTTDVDYTRDGIQHGHLSLPYSHDRSAWGSILIPLTVIKNGAGPTALLTGANHGDEYEGPAALLDLASAIRLEDVSGRIIVVPIMNYPAFQAASRTSPIDGRNMNRTFPGKPDGTVTQKITDYFQRSLLPLSDYVLDIHAGGKTLEFIPFACIHPLTDKTQEARCIAAMKAFNAPYSLKLLEIDAVGMYDTAAEEQGKIFVSTELGGGGTLSATTAKIAKKGVRNLLIHAGILTGTPETEPSVDLDMPDQRCYVTAKHAGLFEPCLNLGDRVQEGDVVARIHDITHSGRTATEYHARISGVFAGKHFPGLIYPGDFICVIGVD
ncbi:MAG: N-alpha-acetyl diaminobutyric acid deacetylase DoeB [Rhodospirillales bacterium]|nr:N-alpha-acetyl diaminobutyric acid deacetylase DoeB [Rhodospirillales bacterium]